MILILDASNRSSFIALIKESEVVDIEHLSSALPLSQALYPSLEVLLQRNSLMPGDVKKVVYGRGPGSFLGIRTAANLASAFQCSLRTEVGSFMSPLAYLPFSQGTFAYAMRPKGGKYPLIIGIKDGLNTKVIASHLLGSLEEILTLTKHTSIEHLVLDPSLDKGMGIEKETTPYLQQLACTIHLQKLDVAFLPILAESQEATEATSAQEQNAFGLIYS